MMCRCMMIERVEQMIRRWKKNVLEVLDIESACTLRSMIKICSIPTPPPAGYHRKV
jgi:hypothetical protein